MSCWNILAPNAPWDHSMNSYNPVSSFRFAMARKVSFSTVNFLADSTTASVLVKATSLIWSHIWPTEISELFICVTWTLLGRISPLILIMTLQVHFAWVEPATSCKYTEYPLSKVPFSVPLEFLNIVMEAPESINGRLLSVEEFPAINWVGSNTPIFAVCSLSFTSVRFRTCTFTIYLGRRFRVRIPAKPMCSSVFGIFFLVELTKLALRPF